MKSTNHMSICLRLINEVTLVMHPNGFIVVEIYVTLVSTIFIVSFIIAIFGGDRI